MNLLLDTNALIWWLRDDERLGRPARKMIADATLKPMASIVSFWEVTMKWRAGKMEFSGTHLLDDLENDQLSVLAITKEHLAALDDVEMHYKDPFDHLIIAQAQVERATIITSDREMALYGVPCFPAMR
jgi:PIN domain nuclease of toxin-antitoxin system